jgi:hypothetical protein
LASWLTLARIGLAQVLAVLVECFLVVVDRRGRASAADQADVRLLLLGALVLVEFVCH